MPSRLEFICDNIAEAAWLAALILAPLFINRYAFQMFDPDKALLLRSLAIIAGLAWILKKFQSHKRAASVRVRAVSELPWWQRPLLLPILAVASASILSTLLSVAPSISWWGWSYRMQGTCTLLSYMVLFWVVASGLRTPAQWRRFQYAVILTSFAVSLGGVLQHFNRVPLLFGLDEKFAGRVTSNIGNPIFLAGYLMMTVPLTLSRLICEVREALREKHIAGRILVMCVLGLILLTQIAAIVLADSRGPWIGISAATFATILLYLVRLRRGAGRLCLGDISLALGVSAFGGAVLILAVWVSTQSFRVLDFSAVILLFLLLCFLYIFLLINGHTRWLWLSWLSQAALAAIFLMGLALLSPAGTSRISSNIRNTTIEVRRLIWQGAVDLFRKNEPLVGTGNTTDTLSSVRRWIGYGPETISLVSLRYSRPELMQLQPDTVWDSAHNDSFDSLITTGVVGIAVNLLFYFAFLYYELRWLNLLEDTRDRKIYACLAIVATVLGIAVPCLLGTAYLVGMGILAGFIATVLLYGAYAGIRKAGQAAEHTRDREIILLSILAAFLAHFVEIQFGIATTVSRAYLYLFSAAMVVFGTRGLIIEGTSERATDEVMPAQKQSQRARGDRGGRKPKRFASSTDRYRLVPYAVITAGMLLVMDWNSIFSRGESDAWALFWASWTKCSTTGSPPVTGLGAICIVLLTIAAGFMLARRNTSSLFLPRQAAGHGLPLFLGITLSVWVGYGLIHSARVQPSSGPLAPEAAASLVSGLLDLFVVSLGILFIALVASLGIRDNGSRKWSQSSPLAYLVGVLFLVGAVVLIDCVTIEPLRADMYFKLGVDTQNAGALQKSVFLYERAVHAARDPNYYQFFLGQSMIDAAASVTDSQPRRRIFDQAERIVKDTLQANRFSCLNIRNLAHFCVARAEGEEDSGLRRDLLQNAVIHFEEAGRLWPANSDLRQEWGHAHFLLGENERARQLYQESIDLNPNNDESFRSLGELESARGHLEEALAAFSRACVINSKNMKAQADRIIALKQLNRYNEDVAASLDTTIGSSNDPTMLHQLASIYTKVGDFRRALFYAQRAYVLLPPDQQAAYYPTIQQLQNRLAR